MDRRIRRGIGRSGNAGVLRWHRRNAPAVRTRICEGLGFRGIELDEKRNVANEGVISAISRVTVRVIRTDEEQMIRALVVRRARTSNC